MKLNKKVLISSLTIAILGLFSTCIHLEKHHTSLSKLKKANGLRSDTIQIGQILKIP